MHECIWWHHLFTTRTHRYVVLSAIFRRTRSTGSSPTYHYICYLAPGIFDSGGSNIYSSSLFLAGGLYSRRESHSQHLGSPRQPVYRIPGPRRASHDGHQSFPVIGSLGVLLRPTSEGWGARHRWPLLRSWVYLPPLYPTLLLYRHRKARERRRDQAPQS